MDRRTRDYLAGRFRDHYRRTDVDPPPDADRREWGYIPFQRSEETTMVRHRGLVDLGDLDAFLPNQQPRHVYYSAGRYDDPAAGRMGDKGWRGADLVFDLDADHLPGVDPETPYDEMLARCKAELLSLLDLLERDFGFTDLDVIFSGGRGYHVHVRHERVRELTRESRRQIAEYVSGENVRLDGLVERELVAGVGRETPAAVRRIPTDRGWGGRLHAAIMDRVEELRALPDEDARARLESIEGIGERRAEAIRRVVLESREEIAAGNVDVHGAFPTFVESVLDDVAMDQGAAIDEPVTTDVNRLIRLPGSLHGGSGLVTRHIDPDSLDMFDPLEHAIPETFRGNRIAIETDEATTAVLGGRRREIEPGGTHVPEFVGVHLMATGRARKAPERG